MQPVDINWITVIVATAVNIAVGWAWYSPGFFAKEWSKLVGKNMKELQANASSGYLATIVGAFIQSLILSVIVSWSGAITLLRGAWVGFLVWLGFVAITQGVNTVFAGTQKKLWAINTGYFLVVLLINGAILAAWR